MLQPVLGQACSDGPQLPATQVYIPFNYTSPSNSTFSYYEDLPLQASLLVWAYSLSDRLTQGLCPQPCVLAPRCDPDDWHGCKPSNEALLQAAEACPAPHTPCPCQALEAAGEDPWMWFILAPLAEHRVPPFRAWSAGRGAGVSADQADLGVAGLCLPTLA